MEIMLDLSIFSYIWLIICYIIYFLSLNKTIDVDKVC